MTFQTNGQIDFPMHVYGKNIEKSIYQVLLEANVSYLTHILY